MHQNLYGNYRNLKFTDIWENASDFLSDYSGTDDEGVPNIGIPTTISDTSATTLYYLLYGRYGNSTIASSDINQFKYKVFSTIFMYGPTWEKRLEVQEAVRKMDLDALMDGGKAVYNTALNPNQPVANGQGSTSGEGTNTLDELSYINQQNTTRYKKSKVDAYAILTNLLETDVTESFIGQFKKLFLTVVSPELPLWYITSPEHNLLLQGDDEDE